MTRTIDRPALDRALLSLPQRFRGPGGVAGIVQDGRVIARQAWGHADLATGLPLTAAMRMPICSISKQFTSAVLLDLLGDPSRLDGRVRDCLPRLEGRLPSVTELCDMQSGLRDYWALTVLQGAQPEGLFRREDARPMMATLRSTHFAPGTSYSYSNVNFRILSDLLEDHAGRSLAELYRERVFGPAGMQTAILAADTRERTDGVVGYEGNHGVGYFAATNRIFWTGDAGIAASLDDMLAWEAHIDATRDDAASLYRRLSRAPRFANGTPARYGFGLAHGRVGDIATTGHGGALRGFRAHRLHAPAARLSVVVLFNHEASAYDAAHLLMRAALSLPEEAAPGTAIPDGWTGSYLDAENGLLLDLAARPGGIDARYATSPERLGIGTGGTATSPAMSLSRDGDSVTLTRPGEDLTARAVRIAETAPDLDDLPGRYHSDETDAVLVIERSGASLSGRFEGILGTGPVHPVYSVGADVATLACQRSMDAPAPGDWTIQLRRGADGKVGGLVLGCWLARNIAYRKTG